MSELKIGSALYYLRRSKNLTQTQLAHRMGYKHPSYIYELEQNMFSPTLTTLSKLAEALEIELWRFIRYAERRNKK